jgi:hypothetical protein
LPILDQTMRARTFTQHDVTPHRAGADLIIIQCGWARPPVQYRHSSVEGRVTDFAFFSFAVKLKSVTFVGSRAPSRQGLKTRLSHMQSCIYLDNGMFSKRFSACRVIDFIRLAADPANARRLTSDGSVRTASVQTADYDAAELGATVSLYSLRRHVTLSELRMRAFAANRR